MCPHGCFSSYWPYLFLYMYLPVVGVVFPSSPRIGSFARIVVLALCAGEGVWKQVIVYDWRASSQLATNSGGHRADRAPLCGI